MGRLIKYELYKLFSKKSFIVAAIFFLLILMFASYGSVQYFYKDFGNPQTFFDNYYKGKEGPVSQSLNKEAQDYFNKASQKSNQDNNSEKAAPKTRLDGNSIYYMDAHQAFEFTQYKKENIDEINAITAERLKTYGTQDYEYKYAKLHSDLVNNQQPYGVYFDRAWRIMGSNVVFPIIAALILLVITPIFNSEYSYKTDSLILTSKRGKSTIITAKIIAAAIFSGAVSLFYNFFNLLSIGAYIGFYGAGARQSCVSEPMSQPFVFTNFGFFLTTTFIMTFAAICIAVMIALISSLMKNQLAVFFISAVTVAAPAVYSLIRTNLQITKELSHFLDAVCEFSYYKILRPDRLFIDFRAYNIFGSPVLSCIVIPVAFFVLTAILVYLIYPAFKKHQVN